MGVLNASSSLELHHLCTSLPETAANLELTDRTWGIYLIAYLSPFSTTAPSRQVRSFFLLFLYITPRLCRPYYYVVWAPPIHRQTITCAVKSNAGMISLRATRSFGNMIAWSMSQHYDTITRRHFRFCSLPSKILTSLSKACLNGFKIENVARLRIVMHSFQASLEDLYGTRRCRGTTSHGLKLYTHLLLSTSRSSSFTLYLARMTSRNIYNVHNVQPSDSIFFRLGSATPHEMSKREAHQASDISTSFRSGSASILRKTSEGGWLCYFSTPHFFSTPSLVLFTSSVSLGLVEY